MRRDSTRRVSYLAPLVVSLLLCSVLVLSLAGCQTAAAKYPSREITYIVPSQQGTSTDMAAKTLVDATLRAWPEAKITMKNLNAGGGTQAVAEVFSSKPDGYTIAMSYIMPFTMQPWLMGSQLPYKSAEEFTIVHQVFSRANVLCVLPDSKYNTVQDLIDDFKSGKRTEPFTYSGRGVGNAEQLTMEMLLRQAGLPEGVFKLVPYASDGEATAAVLGGHIEGTNFMWASSKSMVVDKKLKPLVSFVSFPGMEQYGVKPATAFGYNVDWSPKHYNIMPKGTPADIVAKVDEMFHKGMQDPKFAEYLDTTGDFVAYDTGANAQKYLIAEREAEGKLAQELGLVK